MSKNPFLIRDVVWSVDEPHLPNDTIVDVSGSLLDVNFEDYESEEPPCTCEVSEDDDDYEDFDCLGERYEPSEAALKAFDRDWDESRRRYLEEQHGAAVVSYGYYGPAPEEPVRVSLWVSSAETPSLTSPEVVVVPPSTHN